MATFLKLVEPPEPRTRRGTSAMEISGDNIYRDPDHQKPPHCPAAARGGRHLAQTRSLILFISEAAHAPFFSPRPACPLQYPFFADTCVGREVWLERSHEVLWPSHCHVVAKRAIPWILCEAEACRDSRQTEARRLCRPVSAACPRYQVWMCGSCLVLQSPLSDPSVPKSLLDQMSSPPVWVSPDRSGRSPVCFQWLGKIAPTAESYCD